MDPSGESFVVAAAVGLLSVIFAGIATEFYGAVTDRPQVIELGQHIRQTGEFGGAGLVEAGGGMNPITGRQGVAAEVKTCSVEINSGVKKLDPNEINFSQRTVGPKVEKYTADMESGNWNWNESGPIRIMEREGQWVSYDNKRLIASQNAGIKHVPIQVVLPNEIAPVKNNLTWEQAFVERFYDLRNLSSGGFVPNTGLKSQPSIFNKKTTD